MESLLTLLESVKEREQESVTTSEALRRRKMGGGGMKGASKCYVCTQRLFATAFTVVGAQFTFQTPNSRVMTTRDKTLHIRAIFYSLKEMVHSSFLLLHINLRGISRLQG